MQGAAHYVQLYQDAFELDPTHTVSLDPESIAGLTLEQRHNVTYMHVCSEYPREVLDVSPLLRLLPNVISFAVTFSALLKNPRVDLLPATIRTLTIINTGMTRATSEFSRLVNLVELYLTGNKLVYVAPCILKLPNLYCISLIGQQKPGLYFHRYAVTCDRLDEWNELEKAVQKHCSSVHCVDAVVAYLYCHTHVLARSVAHTQDVAKYVIGPMLLATYEDPEWHEEWRH